MFDEKKLFVYDLRNNELLKINEKVKGNLVNEELPTMYGGTCTLVKDKFINISRVGTYVFDPI